MRNMTDPIVDAVMRVAETLHNGGMIVASSSAVECANLLCDEIDSLRARVAELDRKVISLEAEVGRWRSDWTHLKAAIVTMPTYAYCERHRGGAREIDIDSIRLGLIDRYSAIERDREKSKRVAGETTSDDAHSDKEG